MNRLRQRQCEVVADAIESIPQRLRPLVECDLLCTDPVFAGLHTFTEMSHQRSYRTVAHACYPEHTSDRRLTVVMPMAERRRVAIHELGHILHWNLQRLAGGWDRLPHFEPVSDYAASDDWEAFAEAFTAWFYPVRQIEADPHWRMWSRANSEFFDRLAVGA